MKKIILVFSLLLVNSAYADSEFQVDPQEETKQDTENQDKSSDNFHKTKDFLPGEEVITTTGQKVRVWSTKGPVKVSPAPEPFRDREREKINGNINLYDDSLKNVKPQTNSEKNN